MISPDFTKKTVNGRSLNGWQLGHHLGSRDRAHIHRWTSAGVRAREALPKCEAIAAGTGQRCRLLPLRGSTCCLRHSRGKQLDTAGRALAASALDIVENGGSPVQTHRATRTLARIARRNLHQLWKIDPRINGSTLALDDHAERKVAAWLKTNHGVDLDRPLPNSSEPPTPRCADRMRWAAYRVLRRGHAASNDFRNRAKRRVELAIADDLKFWKKLEAFDASSERN